MSDQTQHLQAQIQAAYETKTACRIEGANSKYFLGNESRGELISTKEHSGVLNYDASELVITVRSGTTLEEINNVLAEHNQHLPFEPPAFSAGATIGGTIACNLSGPARAYSGAARDFVLGANIINGKAELLQFGGQVMKNVAGYDASRLMAGAYGTLGLILDVSLKVLPRASTETTLKAGLEASDAIKSINQLAGKNLPISASCYLNGNLYIRLNSSTQNTKTTAKNIARQLNAQEIDNSEVFWQQIREQQHEFFQTEQSILRLSLPATVDDIAVDGQQLIEWGGALRWLKTDQPVSEIRELVSPLEGHVTTYKNNNNEAEYFQPLDKGILNIHQRLKQAFDPAGILNPGRLYKEL